MPKRTKEELEQIRDDFILIKKLWDEKLEGKSSVIDFFDGKSREEEVIESIIEDKDHFKNLLNSGQIKSCEGLSYINKAIKDCDNLVEECKAMWYIPMKVSTPYSFEYKPVGDLSIDEITDFLINDPFNKHLNDNLDKIGTTACIPIACDEKILEEAKSLAFNSDEVTISEKPSFPSNSKPTREV